MRPGSANISQERFAVERQANHSHRNPDRSILNVEEGCILPRNRSDQHGTVKLQVLRLATRFGYQKAAMASSAV